MVKPETFLKTGQVAEALGVSVSTVKRWIDSGEIDATRTVGKHRLITKSSVVRFAQRAAISSAALDKAPTPNLSVSNFEEACESLINALKSGQADEASTLMRAVLEQYDAAELGDRLIRPVMERIGQGWMIGTWDIYEEHRACRTLSAAIQQIIASTPRPSEPPRPLAIGAAPEGDQYVLPGLLCELTLLEGGWNVQNLGTDLPMRSLATAVRDLKPRLAFLTASHLADPDRFVQEYAYFYEAAFRAGTAIVVGGRALGPEVRPHLIYASYGDRLTHLAEFARRLLIVPAT